MKAIYESMRFNFDDHVLPQAKNTLILQQLRFRSPMVSPVSIRKLGVGLGPSVPHREYSVLVDG